LHSIATTSCSFWKCSHGRQKGLENKLFVGAQAFKCIITSACSSFQYNAWLIWIIIIIIIITFFYFFRNFGKLKIWLWHIYIYICNGNQNTPIKITYNLVCVWYYSVGYFSKMFFTWKYIKINFFQDFLFYFLHQHIKIIENH